MHDYSLPRSDRSDRLDDAPPPPPPDTGDAAISRRPAAVLRLPDRSYFAAWRSGGFFRVQTMQRAKLFVIDGELLRRTVKKLERRGIEIDVILVEVKVGMIGR